MVVDFRKINEQIEYWSYPLMTIEQIFSKLHGARLITTFDVRSRYYKIQPWVNIVENILPSQQSAQSMSFFEHGYFSFCLFKCRLVDFSQEQNQILRLQTSFCQFQTWLLPGLRKMLTSGIFQHKMVSQCWWALQFCCTHVVFLLLWQMFKPLLYGIMMLFGRCYCLIAMLMQLLFFIWLML